MLKGWAGPGRSGMGGGAGPGTWCLGAALRPGGALPVPGGFGLPWARHSVVGLVALGPPICPQVVFFFFLGCWGMRWGGAMLFPCWGHSRWAWVMVGLSPGLLRLV